MTAVPFLPQVVEDILLRGMTRSERMLERSEPWQAVDRCLQAILEGGKGDGEAAAMDVALLSADLAYMLGVQDGLALAETGLAARLLTVAGAFVVALFSTGKVPLVYEDYDNSQLGLAPRTNQAEDAPARESSPACAKR